jgi:hypothetical protein
MPLIAVVVLIALVYATQAKIDKTFGEYRSTEEILYVENGEVLKKVLVGFDNLAADIYWLRTVQYFGGKRLQLTNKNYDLLEPLLRITTTLDPNFKIAYSYGATFLSEPFPFGAGLPVKGIELIETGIKNHPDYWRFYLDKGFIYYWYLQDYEKAAETFLEGSKLPGAPYWMVGTAGRALTEGGHRDTARQLWKILYETAETEQQRENAAIHLMQLDALDQIDKLEAMLTKYDEKTGRQAQSWNDLVHAGYLRGIPVDPTGAPYQLDGENQKVEINQASKLQGLPSH